LVAWLMIATFLSPRWGLSVCGFLTHGFAVGCALSPLRGYSLSCFAAILCSRFAAILRPASRPLCVAATRLILYRRFRGYSWKVGAAERRKNAAHGASRG